MNCNRNQGVKQTLESLIWLLWQTHVLRRAVDHGFGKFTTMAGVSRSIFPFRINTAFTSSLWFFPSTAAAGTDTSREDETRSIMAASQGRCPVNSDGRNSRLSVIQWRGQANYFRGPIAAR